MSTVTAFVTGADHPTALGAARGLRAAGARVVGFTHRPGGWTCRSRAWHELRVYPEVDLLARVEEIVQRAAEVEGPVFLLPTEDDMVHQLSTSREMLPDNVRASLPEHEVVELLLHKTRFLGWARQRGYPLPESEVVQSRPELESLLQGFRFPAVLKPLVRTRGWQQASPVEKVLFLSGPEDLKKVTFDLFEAAPSYVLSEWIEGEDSDVYFTLVYLDENSEVLASHSGRKLLQYPRLTGSTAICVDHPNPELEDLASNLLREAGCRGLAALEVKKSRVDGRLLITEPAVGRPYLPTFSAVSSGVNLYGIAMRHAWGRDYSDLITPRRRCVWVEERGVFENLTSRTGIPIPFGLIAREILRARRLRGAYFRILDPRPGLAMVRDRLGNAFRRLRPGDPPGSAGGEVTDT